MLRFELNAKHLSGLWIITVLMLVSSCKMTGLTREQQIRQLDKISWIVGQWKSSEGGIMMREDWVKESDTLYSGISHVIIEGDTIFNEKIAIKPGKRHIYYIVSMVVNDKPQQHSFILKKNGAGNFVVEDPQNLDLSKISYTKKGPGQMRISTQGIEEGEAVRETYNMVKIN